MKYSPGDKCMAQDKEGNYVSGIFVGITHDKINMKDKIVMCHRNGNEFYLRKYPYQINKDNFQE